MSLGEIRGLGSEALTRAGHDVREVERLRESSSLLESEFVATLFRTMRETVPEESPGAGGAADIFWSMMEREIADRFSLGGGYGLGEAMSRSLSQAAGLPGSAGEGGAPDGTGPGTREAGSDPGGPGSRRREFTRPAPAPPSGIGP